MSEITIDCVSQDFLPSDDMIDRMYDYAYTYFKQALERWFMLESSPQLLDLDVSDMVCALIFSKDDSSLVLLNCRNSQSGIYTTYVFYAPEHQATLINTNKMLVTIPDGLDNVDILPTTTAAVSAAYKGFLIETIGNEIDFI